MTVVLRCSAWGGLLVLLPCACTTPERAQASESSAGDAAPASSSAAPHSKCLVAQACLMWQGCVRIVPAAGKDWTVVQSERADLKGQSVQYRTDNVCSDNTSCPAALIDPAAVQCPPHTIPPTVVRPNFECVELGGRCRSKMFPPPPPPPPSGRALIQQHETDMRGCYPKTAEGVVVMTWLVAAAGAVTAFEVEAKASDVRDPKAEACVFAVLKRVPFRAEHAAKYQYRLRLAASPVP